jgi:integrase
VIVMLWRGGLRISEALALTESDLDRSRGAVLIRRGKGGTRREVGMDRWAWERLEPWLAIRATLPVGALFCILRGPTCGQPCSPAGIRRQLHGPRMPPECAGGSLRTRHGSLRRSGEAVRRVMVRLRHLFGAQGVKPAAAARADGSVNARTMRQEP